MSEVQQIETHGRSLRVSVDPEPEQEGRPEQDQADHRIPGSVTFRFVRH